MPTTTKIIPSRPADQADPPVSFIDKAAFDRFAGHYRGIVIEADDVHLTVRDRRGRLSLLLSERSSLRPAPENAATVPGRIFEKAEGWYCKVAGQEHGAWRSAAEARAGMKIEQRRAAARQTGAAN